MVGLPKALAAAHDAGRTPLVIDGTGDDEGGGGTTPLEVFYSYSGEVLLEMKRFVVEVSVKKAMTVEEALKEARTKLVAAMKCGASLVVLLSDAAPPIKSKFTSPATLPYTLFEDYGAVAMACGEHWRSSPWCRELSLAEADNIVLVHENFRVCVVTKFSREDYAEFLADELPLGKMQHIFVRRS